MTILRVAILFVALIVAPLVRAADSHVGANCDLQEFGIKDNTEFLRLDHELRYALDKGDAAALALLVQFPLRVNYPDNSRVGLSEAATLQKQFDRVFPRALRDAVKQQSLDDLICKYSDGIGYANGGLWVGPAGPGRKQLRLIVVNVPGDESAERKSGEIDLACSTKQFRIVIDFTGGESKVRYRAWNLPRSTNEKPDLELIGKRHFEGTSPCTARVWDFRNANAIYSMSEPGCGQDAPPAGALAQLLVSIDGKQKVDAWCF